MKTPTTEIGDGYDQPNPNERMGAVDWRSIFSLIDLRGDKDKQRQQNQPYQRYSKRVHRGSLVGRMISNLSQRRAICHVSFTVSGL